MIRYQIIFILFTCTLLFSCKTYQPGNFPDTVLKFGSGGGFTGMTTEYLMLKNGQIFTRTGRAGSGEWQELTGIKRSKARMLYRTWENKEAFKRDIQQPGNLYYFISMQKDSSLYRQSWGASGYTPPEPVKALFNDAMKMVKDASPKNEDH